MSKYPLRKLIERWQQELMTVEQAIGQVFLHLGELYQRLKQLDQRLRTVEQQLGGSSPKPK